MAPLCGARAAPPPQAGCPGHAYTAGLVHGVACTAGRCRLAPHAAPRLVQG
jgi:hypothetical protein